MRTPVRTLRPLAWATIALLPLLGAGCGGSGGDGDNGAPASQGAETAFVTTTDFTTGSYFTIDLTDLTPSGDLPSTAGIIESDNSAAYFNGKVYVINRGNFSNITVLDTADLTTAVSQFSTGNGTNPHAMAFVSDTKAYVSLYGADYILIVDPTDQGNEVKGQIDISAFADADGIPEASPMVIVGDKLFVAVQRLDRDAWFAPTDASYLVVIDTATDEIVDVDPSTPDVKDPIVLTGTNPQFMRYDEGLGKIVVSETGGYGAQDGGLETVDPATYEAEGFFVTEEALGGDVGDFALVDGTRGYAVVTLPSWANDVAVLSKGDAGWEVTGTLGMPGAFIPSLALDSTGRLLVPDRTAENPGVRIFDADGEVTTEPIRSGEDSLPPNVIVVY